MTTDPIIPGPDEPPLTYLTKSRLDLVRRRDEEAKRHELADHELQAAIRQVDRERDLVLRGVPLEQVRVAETVLDVSGDRKRANDERCITLAINDLASGCQQFRRFYAYVKDYDRFHGQSGWCSYGMAPSHGSVVFSIRLHRDLIGLRGRDLGLLRDLTAEETEAALAYLLAIRDGG